MLQIKVFMDEHFHFELKSLEPSICTFLKNVSYETKDTVPSHVDIPVASYYVAPFIIYIFLKLHKFNKYNNVF